MDGGIFADNSLIEGLLRKAYTVYPARLEEIVSNKNISETKCFRIKANATLGVENIKSGKCTACRNLSTSWPSLVCLHYIY